jgi:hypothetical protein
MKNFKNIVLAAIVAVAGIATSAHAAVITGHPASLIGETITAQFEGAASATTTIGDGREFYIQYTGYNVVRGQRVPYTYEGIVFDFGANTLTITTPNSNQGVEWGDWGKLTFSGFDAILTGLTVASNSGFGTDLTYDALLDTKTNSIVLDFDGGSTNNKNAKLVFNVTAVPEPGSVALLGLGLMGVIAARRKSAKSKNA